MKNFNDFISENNTYDENVYTEKEKGKFPVTIRNAKKLMDLQKTKGGVISIPNTEEAKKIYTNFGYEIKYLKTSEALTDEQLKTDIHNYNKVNYVVCLINDQEPQLMEVE